MHRDRRERLDDLHPFKASTARATACIVTVERGSMTYQGVAPVFEPVPRRTGRTTDAQTDRVGEIKVTCLISRPSARLPEGLVSRRSRSRDARWVPLLAAGRARGGHLAEGARATGAAVGTKLAISIFLQRVITSV